MITVQSYLAEFGVDALHGEAPHPRCPLCHRALLLIGALSTHIRPRFSHGSRVQSRCPLVRHGELPNELLINDSSDIEIAVAQRQAFFARWQWHYHLMRRADLMPSMSIGRFLGLAELSTQRGLWRYTELNLALAPYIQLAMAGFLPGERGQRNGGSWIRFWFDASVRSIADLHAGRHPAPRFFKTHYVRPRIARTPSSHHVFHLEEVALDLGYLENPAPETSAADIAACWEWMTGRGS